MELKLKMILHQILLLCLCFELASTFADDSAYTVSAGANLTLSCPRRAEVTDPIMVTWTCRGCRSGQGQTAVTVARYRRDGSVETPAAGGARSRRVQLLVPSFQLQLQPVTTADAGVYVCSINNAPSADSIVVKVDDVPRAPQRPLVVSFTSRSAELSWAPLYSDTDAPALTYVIQKRQYDPPGSWDLQNEVTVPDNSTTFNVTGLKPFTAYSFRIFSVNPIGRSLASDPSYPMVTHREAPTGKPTVERILSTAPDAIEIVWRPPAAAEINGEFIGFVVTYRARTARGDNWTRLDLPGQLDQQTNHLFEHLIPFTEYLFRIQVKNMMGTGPITLVKETTKDGAPGEPRNLSFSALGDSWAQLSWRQPLHPNGIIVGYYMYLEFTKNGENLTDSRIIQMARQEMSYNLTGLAPNTRYSIWLHAKTSKHEGGRSPTLKLRTDVGGASAPQLTNVSCRDDTSIQLAWRRPRTLNGGLNFYYVLYRAGRDEEYDHVEVPSSEQVKEETLLIANLTGNTVYTVTVVAITRSRLNASRLYWGERSSPREVVLQPHCERMQELNDTRHSGQIGWDLSSGMVAGLACASFALLLAMIALIFWRKYFQAAYNYLDEPAKSTGSSAAGGVSTSACWECDCADGGGAPIPVHLFPKHVARLHADGDIGFSKEYEAIQTQTIVDGFASDLSHQGDNKDKNRYLNIVAYDHTRVPLQPSSTQASSRGHHHHQHQQSAADYVNANFVDGYQRRRAYIGTQGPLPATFAAFWRMCWEQNVHIVVMITNLVERGRKKCDMYWPQEGSETYGAIRVTALGQDVMATYTIRKFRIQHLKIKKKSKVPGERIVYQYHYTNWPDHGIPESPLPILSFVRKSAAANPDSAGPIVVHCSAGVGRTGTYIVLDSMMRMIRAKAELNVFGFLKYIRTQRNFLVQTEEQYVFVHDALVEAIECGETDIHRTFLRRYLHNLQTTEQDIYPWYNLERQYRMATYEQRHDLNVSSARHPANAHKIRCRELVPSECSRVCLAPRPGVAGSDFVNASWLPGFSRLREFIVTQHPLATTVAAFWQMVWEHNAQTIVLLSPVDDQEFCIFWPLEHDEIDCEQFRVMFAAETQAGAYVLRDFSLQSHTDDYELSVRIIQCSGWPGPPCGGAASPAAAGHALDLVHVVQQWHLEYQNGPCLVVDRLGGGEAATFCLLTTVSRQLQYESHADVYMYARLYHARRPGVWAAQHDYLFLYRAVEALVAGDCSATSLTPPPDVADVQPQPLRPILKRAGANCQPPPRGGATVGRARRATGAQTRVPPDGMESIIVNVSELAA